MIDWFDNLSVYLKPLIVIAIALTVVGGAHVVSVISVCISDMRSGKKRTIANIAFYVLTLSLLYAIIVWVFSQK